MTYHNEHLWAGLTRQKGYNVSYTTSPNVTMMNEKVLERWGKKRSKVGFVSFLFLKLTLGGFSFRGGMLR